MKVGSYNSNIQCLVNKSPTLDWLLLEKKIQD